jgi:hypothetical protein
MAGKRFAFGLAAGLLLGLGIIAASAGFGMTYGLYGSLSSSNQGLNTSVTTTSSSTATQAATTTGQNPSSSNSGEFGGVTTTTQGSKSNVNATISALQSELANLSPNVNNIPHQPLLSNAVVFVPVFVAFLLGAVFYRATRQESEKDDAPP